MLGTSKPYFIELYQSSDSTLVNKYKFVIEARKVKQLKAQILTNLLNKQHIDQTTKISIKDTNDFQLASDDEIDLVLSDGKVKAYKYDTVGVAVVPPALTSKSSNTIPSGAQISLPAVAHDIAVTQSLLNLSTFTVPKLPENCTSVFKMFAPQIRRSLIELPLDSKQHSYLSFSQFIINSLSLQTGLKAIVYNKFGQPLLFNLDLMHTLMWKLNLTEQFYVIFTKTVTTIDVEVVPPVSLTENLIQIRVQLNKKSYSIHISAEDTIEALKYKVYTQSRIHPLNQILKFGATIMDNDFQLLKTYKIQANSIVTLSFKSTGNLVPASFSDKFYYNDVDHVREQSEESLIALRANLLAITAHLSDNDKLRVSAFLREFTGNIPLVFAVKLLFKNSFLSQAHRVALEEGFIVALTDYIKKCTPLLATLEFKNIFMYFRQFFGFVLEGAAGYKHEQEITRAQKTIQIQRKCHFTLEPIINPRLLTLDNGEVVLVDQVSMQEQILKGFTYQLLKAPKKENLINSSLLTEAYEIYLGNLIDHDTINSLFWTGFSEKAPVAIVPAIGTVDKHIGRIDNYNNLKVHQPLQVKNRPTRYLLLKNKDGKLLVFVDCNKNINKPYNVFDVVSGDEIAVNLDLMGANVTTENVEEAVAAKLVPKITRDPKEAIIVLFDISSSMGGGFFNQVDMKRIGAVKSFFQAFAYRTIAYNLQHVVSLTFFDNRIQNQCGFTEAIYDFNRLIAKATPRGSTALYDAIIQATKQLVDFRKKYPTCVMRILAMTDGEDTASKNSVENATIAVHNAKIIMDSFAVGCDCEGLKTVTKATGGKCYLTRNLEESLKLFEQETVLSVRARVGETQETRLTIEQLMARARAKPFDLVGNVHAFKIPESKPSLNARDMVKYMQNSEEAKRISACGSLKRIAKQIQHYSDNPHPFVSIYPCANINIWKILLLGPKSTPYENGLFLLYAQFPGDYPMKPPEVRFITPIYHCNMNQQGRICHSVFDRNYSPALTFRQIIDCVYGLILTPEPEDPLDNVIASFYLSDYPTYLKNATNFTKEKASLSSEKIVTELSGLIADDSEKKQKEKEIEEWIMLAKNCN